MIKDAFDRAAAGAMLTPLAPIFAAIAMAIRITDHGPVFFKQTRVGKDGGDFQVWKFRTMVVDAEARKAQLADHNESTGGMLFKMRRDPGSLFLFFLSRTS
jgi:lipopolysaccharide/colanic/teichoic acid biosynthesis glycosyltransferase